jgi:hypothetical protein
MQESPCDEDQLDASRDYPVLPRNSSPKLSEQDLSSLTLNEDQHYEMTHKVPGVALLFYNTVFDTKFNLPRRTVDRDLEKIRETFGTKLGFQIQEFKDKKAVDMCKNITDVSEMNHSKYDCIAIFVLTHGEKGNLYATDELVTVEDLVKPLKTCKSLFQKPKLIFIQTWDYGVTAGRMSADADDDSVSSTSQVVTLPMEADFLYAYSSADGYVSFNNPKNGSWFIQALCAEFDRNVDKYDILTMLTRVSHKIAYEHSSNTPSNPATHNLRQVSSVTTTLTKILNFCSSTN